MNIRTATIEDAAYVAEHLRAADVLELSRLGKDRSEVEASFRVSDVVRVIEYHGRPAVIFGRAPVDFMEGALVWMLATPAIELIERGFVLACKPELARLLDGCGQLMNMTHRDNEVCLRWLRWLGFSMSDKPCGPGGEFVHFWLKEEAHV